MFVRNLPWAMTESDLSEHLGNLGLSFGSVKVILDRDTGRSRGFAFVEFLTEAEASMAIKVLSGYIVDGRVLYASEARQQEVNKSRGDGTRSAGFSRCGSKSQFWPPEVSGEGASIQGRALPLRSSRRIHGLVTHQLFRLELRMAPDDRYVTLRRTIEQAIHCLIEADSVLKNKEDPRCAANDVQQAQALINCVIQPGIEKILQCTTVG